MSGHSDEISYRALNMPFGTSVLAIFEKNFPPDNNGQKDSLHFHNHLEIGYCYYGHGNMILGDKKIPHGSNIFTIIPQNTLHRTEINDKIGCSWEYLMINTTEFLSNVYKETLPQAENLIYDINCQALLFKAEDHPETANLIRKIISIMRDQEELYLEEARGLIFALLIRIARWNRYTANGRSAHHIARGTIIFPALNYINTEPGRPIKIDELAKICHISETHFRRVFAEYMKISPVKYINRQRIRKACYELTHTNDSINAIAARAGFTTLSTFNRNFRQIIGISPQQFRKHPELYIPDQT